MSDDIREQIVDGIRRYLDHQFPGTEFDNAHDAESGNVTFHLYAGDTHYQLKVTSAFLQGRQGTDTPIQQLTDWHVAELLLEAKDRIVTLETTGAHMEP